MKRHLLSLLFVSMTVSLSGVARADGPFGSGDAETDSNAPPPEAQRAEANTSDVAPSAPPVRPTPKPSPPVGLRLDGGYAPRELFALPILGADMGLALGVQPGRHVAIWGASRLFLGSTRNGVDVLSVRLGPEVEVVVDRFRFGAGVHAFLVGVSRVTRDDTIFSGGPAVAASARIDLFQADSFALFARGAIEAGWEIHSDAIFWGPTLGAGIDFDLAGNHAALR